MSCPNIVPEIKIVETTSEAIEVDDYVSNEIPEIAHDDRSLEEVKSDEQSDDLYNVKNFSL